MPRLGLRLSFLGFAATRCLLILLSTAMLLLTLLTHFLPIAVFYPSASAGIHVDVTYYVWYYRKNTKGGQSAEIHDHSAVPAYTYTAAVEATRVLLVLATILATISLVTSIFFFVMLLRHHARRQRERVRYATARQAASQMNRGPGTALHPHIEPPLSESGNPISAEQAEAQHREEEIRRREVDRLVGILLAVVNLVFLAFLAGFTVSFLAYYLTCSQRTDTGGSTLKKACMLVPIAAIVDLFGLVLLSISNLSGTRLWRTHHTHDIDENLAASFTQRHRLVRLGSSTDHHSSSRPERGGHNYATEDEAVQPAAATRPVSSADSTGEGGGVLLEKGLSSFYQESQLDHPLVPAFSAVAEEEDGAAPPLHGEETALALPQQPKPQQDAPPSSSLPPNTLL